MLFAPHTEFGFVASSHGSTRPATNYGTALTSGAADTYGSYVEVLSDTAVTEDCYGILINCNSVFASIGNRAGTLTIGKDEAGGTSYVDWLTDLIVGKAATYANAAGGVWYYFPMYIKAGTALAAKWACVDATQAARVNLRVYGRPKYPAALRVASKFQSFGASAGNGTSITSGTTSEGSWTQMGSNPSTPLWWWMLGWQSDDTTLGSVSYFLDIARGDASNKHVIMQNMHIWHSGQERIGRSYPSLFYEHDATVNDLIYMRAQCSGTADSTLQCAAYGVG